ncbi:hypothetical protein LXA43DRAFT_1017215 [Ganoderma leucocontextum]|nr:hypothetical protein LXA43DRAFT_1017215 [Ganoderma leucocontextum]
MFPLNDFNFVACALATFSAAVGYNVSRRRGRNSSSGPAESERAKKEKEGRLGFLKFHRRNSVTSARSASVAPSISESDAGTEPPSSKCGTPAPPEAEQEQLELESFPDGLEIARPEDGSLKRKRSPSPRLADADTPLVKRRRTPPAGKEEMDTDEESALKLEDSTPQPFTADDIPGVASAAIITAVDVDVEVPGSGEVPAISEQAPVADELVYAPVPANTAATTASLTALSASPQCLPATRPSVQLPTPGPSWHTGTPIVAARASSAFSAFTGQRSAFANSCVGPQRVPVWSTSTSGSVSIFGDAPADSTSSDANALAASTQSTAIAQKVLTGEEDEEVGREMKGAKVFIKRGDRDFCEGILGNVKFLKHKETGEHRILFRRESVWKVTMSVRLRPTVRCSFDEAQGALRVTLKEPIEDTQQEQLVIYVLKRGKTSRSEFAKFAKVVTGSARLQGRA